MTSKRLALCVGINDYPGTQNDLHGCVNDAKDWMALLHNRGFDEVTPLLDSAATHAAQVDALTGMLGRARLGDTVIYTNSSHGTWIPDTSGDEADGRDEAIVCYDFQNGGLLVDDQILTIAQTRKRGVRFLIFTDSCHSGTVSRFVSASGTHDPRARGRFLPPDQFLDGADLARAVAVQNVQPKGRSRAGAILMAGCADGEFSYDASFGGRPNGAFTRAALDALGEVPSPTVGEWQGLIRHRLPSADYPQTPQLTATTDQKTLRLL